MSRWTFAVMGFIAGLAVGAMIQDARYSTQLQVEPRQLVQAQLLRFLEIGVGLTPTGVPLFVSYEKCGFK